MKNKKLTDNFYLNEFFRNKRIPKTVPDRVLFLIQKQAEMLQYFRGVIGNKSMIITSGVRTSKDYTRLVEAGYRPSITSDHYFGYPVKLQHGTEKYEKYGEYFTDSIGAVDFITTDIDDTFKKIVEDILIVGAYKPKQVIFEISDKGNPWIHISNEESVIFSDKFKEFTGKATQFLYSKDNGRTYEIYDPKNPPVFLK